MQKHLEIIQKFVKEIARLGLEIDRDISLQIELGQWDSWKTKEIENLLFKMASFIKGAGNELVELGAEK